MKDSYIYKKNPEVVTRVFGQETILVPLYKSSKDADCIYTLDAVGARIWSLFDGKKDIFSIKRIILREYAVGPETLDASLTPFLKDLKDIKALV